MGISSSLGSSALLPAGLGFRNILINGNMNVDQRNTAGTPITNSAGLNTYGIDRWSFYGTAAKMTMTQSTDVPSTDVFTKSLKITTAASTFTPGASDYYGVRQQIEGYNFACAAYGTANAKPLVLSFWVKCSTVGTYSVSMFNREGPDRSYVTTYVVNSANTWEKKTIYFQSGDTSGTWLTTNGIGMQLWWDLGSGSSQNATANVWNASLKVNTSLQPNFVGTNAGTFFLAGVQLEQNYQATPFEQRPIGVELALCQRYYWRTGHSGYAVYATITDWVANNGYGVIPLPQPMRVAPTSNYSSLSNFLIYASATTSAPTAFALWTAGSNTTDSFGFQITGSALTGGNKSGWLSNGGSAGWIDFSAEL